MTLRRGLAAAGLVVLLAGCGRSGTSGSKLLADATAKTLAARSAQIRSTTRIDTYTGGLFVYHTHGAVELASRRGHLDEDAITSIYDGGVVYSNIGSPMPPNHWLRHPLGPHEVTTLDHLQLMLHLPSGVTRIVSNSLATIDGTPVRHVVARIAPSRIATALPPTLAPIRGALIGTDYGSKPFDADFWIDREGRLRRVETHTTATFGKALAPVTLLLDLSDLGAPVDSKLPPGASVQAG